MDKNGNDKDKMANGYKMTEYQQHNYIPQSPFKNYFDYELLIIPSLTRASSKTMN
jgi:hypothetical protein